MTDTATGAVPGLARRLAAFVYEGLLLFALAVLTGLVYSPLVDQRNAMVHRTGLIVSLACVFAVYFVYFWSRSGQTLPMRTWRFKLTRLDGAPLSPAHALLRHVLSYAWWVLPIAAASQMLHHGLGIGSVSLIVILALLGYALLALVLPGQQFLHDVLCKTMLVHHDPKKTAPQ
ncbi:RDD family protein [Pelomonas sp. KK5]|uniref:RDD family protein n=1 Tax=Pelomonas sp. KK5 TaxID=1855730 RepID=UPI00097C2147|nr:RDD family protein [Pelomonas sp. KK5]